MQGTYCNSAFESQLIFSKTGSCKIKEAVLKEVYDANKNMQKLGWTINEFPAFPNT
jgi:hypothetical protein